MILFLLSAFFSASEIALMSLPNHKIDSLLKQKKFWANELKYIKDRSDRLLIVILIWNNLVNVSIAALATQLAIGFAQNFQMEQSMLIWISTWIITFLLLMFGEIAPKSYATKNAEKIALYISKIYKFLLILFTPFLFVFEFIIKLITGKKYVAKITDEEIESFIDLWQKAGILEDAQHKKIKSLIWFPDITVEELFIPRVHIDAISIDTKVDKAIDYVLSQTHSRIPVYINTVDNMEYFVDLRFLLAEKKKWNWDKKLSEIEKLAKVIKVPINYPIDNLLEIFRNSRKHLAIVMDEYWWVAGLVTLEDIMEEVFGDIKDEYDIEKDEVKKLSENIYEVDPNIIFEDLLENLWLTFESLKLDEKMYYATQVFYG